MYSKLGKASYFYGPVFSRRLGFSLGVDLLPPKTCSFDCIYCQLGSEPRRSLLRKHWVDMDEFKRQLGSIMENKPVIDYITISGSGEPTLHKDLDKIITTIKTITKNRYPVCVITNSSLLHIKKVRHELRQADVIIPSLDAARASTFNFINKPHKNISLRKIINGLMALRREYKGKIWLEIMFVAGINDSFRELLAFRDIIGKFKPDKVQINIPLRPTPQIVRLPSPEQIKKIQSILSAVTEVETVHELEPKRKQSSYVFDTATAILRLLRVRPETLSNLKLALGINEQTLKAILKELVCKKQIVRLRRLGKYFYGINDSGKCKKHS